MRIIIEVDEGKPIPSIETAGNESVKVVDAGRCPWTAGESRAPSAGPPPPPWEIDPDDAGRPVDAGEAGR